MLYNHLFALLFLINNKYYNSPQEINFDFVQVNRIISINSLN